MRVWFNRHFSVVGRVTRLLREAADQLPLTSIVSHRHAHFSGFATADEYFVEPSGLNPEAYVEWCLATALKRRIDWIVPGHDASVLAAAEARFLAIGVRMLNAASANLLPLLHQKDWVYAHAPASVPRPRFVVINDSAQLEAGLAQIEADGPACIKPCVSVYGHGYHRLQSADWLAAHEDSPGADIMNLDAWRQRYSPPNPDRRQLLMEYLPGVEYSVDLACHQGKVLAGAVRQKSLTEPVQTLEDRPDLIGHASALVDAFGLHGLINVQFKDAADGTSKLLEINPRGSGGIAMSCLSGFNLPLIAYAACLADLRVPLPTPRHGLRIAEVPMAIVVPARRT